MTATDSIEQMADEFRTDVLEKDDRLTGRTLLWRDAEKDRATRAVLDKNAAILTEIASVIRERLPRS